MSRFSSPLRLRRQQALGAAPNADSIDVYAKTDGRLYSRDNSGTETPVAGAVVSATDPGLKNGLWMQTGLGADGQGTTLWIVTEA